MVFRMPAYRRLFSLGIAWQAARQWALVWCEGLTHWIVVLHHCLPISSPCPWRIPKKAPPRFCLGKFSASLRAASTWTVWLWWDIHLEGRQLFWLWPRRLNFGEFLSSAVVSFTHHSFIHQVFVTQVLCSRYCCGGWRFSGEQENKFSDFMELCYCGGSRLVKMLTDNQVPAPKCNEENKIGQYTRVSGGFFEKVT